MPDPRRAWLLAFLLMFAFALARSGGVRPAHKIAGLIRQEHRP
jgi:hypothetical protein